MNFITYLKTKTKFLVIWFVIHGFALFVNVFNIKGNIYYKYIGRGFLTDLSNKINLFTTKDNNENFWPFVDFYSRGDRSTFFFKGIFYDYGIAEFIAYSFFVFIFLYFRLSFLNSKQPLKEEYNFKIEEKRKKKKKKKKKKKQQDINNFTNT